MLTIDWKERLNKDADDYLINKLPKNDFDFEIIFNAYPERINGKVPHDVIVHVAGSIITKLGKNHEKYIPFYNSLWAKKGDYGKTAFIHIMAKIISKKPAVYIPVVESAMQSASSAEMASMMEKIMLPLLRKHPENYLSVVYKWVEKGSEGLRKQAMSLLIKLIKKLPELTKEIVNHFVNQWIYPLGDCQINHVNLLKVVARLDESIYLDIYREYQSSRDPQTVEVLCASIQDYHPELEPIVENWTKSGNARLKKAALTAHRLLLKKKGK
ncbi:MAG: hypothetical protein Q8M98_03145 [Candidatus Cloacimonadaceae bacterium]|nr:hypothetical protein [Candidatus Cloacimonadaceae bacterium]MDP3113751.1 hypothetical protein [Candidatus Cloacimonadaceae bacterium]